MVSRSRDLATPFRLKLNGFSRLAPSQDDHVPNPDEAEIAAVFYSFPAHHRDSSEAFTCQSGIIAVTGDQLNARRLRSVKSEFVDSELELLNRIIDVIIDLDPDIVSGWEVQAASWGYLGARGRSYGERVMCW